MLGIVVAAEEPATEEKRVNLVIESAKAKAQLKDLEDKILQLLSSSTGHGGHGTVLYCTSSKRPPQHGNMMKHDLPNLRARFVMVYECLYTGPLHINSVMGTPGCLYCTTFCYSFGYL